MWLLKALVKICSTGKEYHLKLGPDFDNTHIHEAIGGHEREISNEEKVASRDCTVRRWPKSIL